MSKNVQDKDYRPSKQYRITRTEPYHIRPKVEAVDNGFGVDDDSAVGSKITCVPDKRSSSPIVLEEREASPNNMTEETVTTDVTMTRLLQLMLEDREQNRQLVVACGRQ